MEAGFWHRKWNNNEIGFHGSRPNPKLTNYYTSLALSQGSRIFLPLCGKTLDIGWLLSQGYAIVGVELSLLAIEQLFEELDVTPEIAVADAFTHFQAPQLDLFVGDIFELQENTLGPVDAIYDRAALVALPGGYAHSLY